MQNLNKIMMSGRFFKNAGAGSRAVVNNAQKRLGA